MEQRRLFEPQRAEDIGHSAEIDVHPIYIETAISREGIIKSFQRELERELEEKPDRSRTIIIEKFCTDNRLSRSTFYGWLQSYAESGIEGLIPKYTGGLQKLTRAEQYWLTRAIRDGIRIGTAIVITKYILGWKKMESPSSAATMRRWAKKYKKGLGSGFRRNDGNGK